MVIRLCDCGSGLESWWEYDARGIELCRVCGKCREQRLAHYRLEVLIDPNYETEEPIDDDEEEWDTYEEDYAGEFADPGGRSALRAATPNNPRNLPCPTCGAENRLTPKDRDLGYQCDECAEREEYGLDYDS